MDLVIEDDSRIRRVFFSMSEDNIRKQIRRPWMSFCSDGGSISAEGVFLKRNRHPRTYGTFARLLGKYVRDEKLIPLEEAIRRLTSLPADESQAPAAAAASPPATSPTWSCSTPRRSATTPRSTGRTSTPPACPTSWSTASRSSRTASTPAPSPAESSAAPAGAGRVGGSAASAAGSPTFCEMGQAMDHAEDRSDAERIAHVFETSISWARYRSDRCARDRPLDMAADSPI